MVARNTFNKYSVKWQAYDFYYLFQYCQYQYINVVICIYRIIIGSIISNTCQLMWNKKLFVLLPFIFLVGFSLTIAGQEQISYSQTPFKNIRILQDSVFFTTKNQRSFGYLNGAERGKVQAIYILNEDEKIVDELQNTEHIVIANKNKSLIFFNPQKREIIHDDRFVGQNFTQFISYKKVDKHEILLVEDGVRLYTSTPKGVLSYTSLLSNLNLNPGITQKYNTLFYFPIKTAPNRIVTLTEATVTQDGVTKLLVCFKWFKQAQNFKSDGICHYDTVLDIKSIDATEGWLYLRNSNETYVFDGNMKMVTKWPQLAQQFHGGQAMLETQMTYLFKSNEIAYYRTINNFQNNLNYKVSVNPQSLVVFRKEKRMVKITKTEQQIPIGVWVKQIQQTTFKLLIQFDNMQVNYYKIVKTPVSTQINYLFRLYPKIEQVQEQTEKQQGTEGEKTEGEQANNEQVKAQGTEQTGQTVQVNSGQAQAQQTEQKTEQTQEDSSSSSSSQSQQQQVLAIGGTQEVAAQL